VIVVIGSGPAGVAATHALVARGERVTVLDAGVELEAERRALVDGMAAGTPADWSADEVAEISRQMPASLGGVPLKFTYGSDFPYQHVEQFSPFENMGSATRPTLARGGFSTVWGSAALPYLERDLAEWPEGARSLAPHYRAVAGWMPISGLADGLDPALPLYTENAAPLRQSRQTQALLSDIDAAKDRLGAAGFSAGQSRLAVRAEANESGPGCAYCGLCLNGCPYRLIYDASATLDELLRNAEVDYRPGIVVDRLEEHGDRVTIHGATRDGEEPVRIEADRVYVACGTVGTTRLMLASLDAIGRAVEMKDSQYFLLPWLRLRGVARPREEGLHTLAQAFIELDDPKIDPHNVHLQVYGFNDVFVSLFDKLLGPLSGPMRPLVDAVLSRMLLIQGYLHSDSSPSIRVSLQEPVGGKRGVLELREVGNRETRPALRRVAARLLRHSLDFKALPLWPLLQIAPAGRGFHSGGTFPMTESPGPFQTDVLGRPHGFARVHLADSSTFPTIPSTTITFTVMANAHRIASATP
jgi:choline dehydrogenase-like flavoprotein